MREVFAVYIMTCNTRTTLYVGVTGDLLARIHQHREQAVEGFTSRYHVIHLVFYELFGEARFAIERETQLKKWRREKKVWLIERMNPQWKDLTAELTDRVPKIDTPLPPEAMA